MFWLIAVAGLWNLISNHFVDAGTQLPVTAWPVLCVSDGYLPWHSACWLSSGHLGEGAWGTGISCWMQSILWTRWETWPGTVSWGEDEVTVLMCETISDIFWCGRFGIRLAKDTEGRMKRVIQDVRSVTLGNVLLESTLHLQTERGWS